MLSDRKIKTPFIIERQLKKTSKFAVTKEAFGVHFSELGPRMLSHFALSDDIAGEEVQLRKECFYNR